MLRKLLLGCVLGTLGSIPALALSAPERLTIGMTLEPLRWTRLPTRRKPLPTSRSTTSTKP